MNFADRMKKVIKKSMTKKKASLKKLGTSQDKTPGKITAEKEKEKIIDDIKKMVEEHLDKTPMM